MEKTLEIHLQEERVEIFKQIMDYYFDQKSKSLDSMLNAMANAKENPDGTHSMSEEEIKKSLHMQSFANGIEQTAYYVMGTDNMRDAYIKAGLLADEQE